MYKALTSVHVRGTYVHAEQRKVKEAELAQAQLIHAHTFQIAALQNQVLYFDPTLLLSLSLSLFLSLSLSLPLSLSLSPLLSLPLFLSCSLSSLSLCLLSLSLFSLSLFSLSLCLSLN